MERGRFKDIECSVFKGLYHGNFSLSELGFMGLRDL
jgi:hypothetical protein